MLEVCIARGLSLGWNKSFKCILPQSHVLNDLYCVCFGHSRHLPSCYFWTLKVFRMLPRFDCVIRTYNIFPFICVDSVWAFCACDFSYCHPFCIAPIVGWYVLKA